MSSGQEPKLADVLAEVKDARVELKDLTTEVKDVRVELKDLTTEVKDVRVGLKDLSAEVTDVRVEVKDMRVSLMGRMDRLQDSLTEQRSNITVVLEMTVANKAIADGGLSEARAALDVQSSATSALAVLQQQLRRLQDEVKELRNGRT